MKKNIIFFLLPFFISSCANTNFNANAIESLITVESPFSSKETADKFVSIINNKGLTLFARIDHQKNAAGVGLTLRNTEVIIFGNPKVGTPLMQCSQSVGIDLPQKVLVWTDADNKVWLAYNNPQYLKARHHLGSCDNVIERISTVLSGLTSAAVAQK